MPEILKRRWFTFYLAGILIWVFLGIAYGYVASLVGMLVWGLITAALVTLSVHYKKIDSWLRSRW